MGRALDWQPGGPGSGGPWGVGALGPAILWGPLQGCDPTFHSWGVGGGGAVSPTTVSGAQVAIFFPNHVPAAIPVR